MSPGLVRKRRRQLPLELELQQKRVNPYTAPPPGLWSRFRSRQRRRGAPKTLRGALALALVRLTILGGVGAASALAIARVLGRDLELGFYIAGAGVLAVAFLSTAGDVETPDYYGQDEKEYRVRSSLSYILVGLMLVGVAVVLETR